MNTEKLYYNDPYIKEFNATVLRRGITDGKFWIILDRTAFYPEGGGQPFDTGFINSSRVVEVFEEEGVIYHYTESEVIENKVNCSLDWNRRFDHMQQHLGQHILSGAFDKLYQGETVGFHLGQDYVTIDISIDSFEPKMIGEVEGLANSIVQSCLKTRIYYVDQEGIKNLPMRKLPKVDTNIRIVQVGDFDYSGCGGTHPHNTGEVGLIKIINWEKSKGNIRIYFLCGNRAIEDYSLRTVITNDCSSLLSLHYKELKDGVTRLKDDIHSLTKANKGLKMELSQFKANKYYDKAEIIKDIRFVKDTFVNEDLADIKNICNSILTLDKVVVLFGNKGSKAQLLFGCSKDINFNMNNIMKEVLPLIEGTGGGNQYTAQGGGSQVSNTESAIIAAYQIIVNRYLGGK